MSRSDLIADTFTMIRNAIMAHKDSLDVPASKVSSAIMEILKNEGYIDNYKPIEDKKQGILRIYLKYVSGKPAIMAIKRISRPGLRHHVRAGDIPEVLRGRGLAILSTSSGIMTGKAAKEKNAGGEVIGYVW
ncbi:MAG: 30S ribosomal protein S8 [Candidatus Omnitrophica bacterium]|nr:30S ribosomal protein S8 [Candidatus Omnitrophota bacterium]MDD5774830.1 30S ribosomal protein S8 [Candidatus Omnitrophota bacterium]